MATGCKAKSYAVVDLARLGFAPSFIACCDAYFQGGTETKDWPIVSIYEGHAAGESLAAHLISKTDLLSWNALKSFDECEALGLHRALSLDEMDSLTGVDKDKFFTVDQGPVYFVSHKWHNGVPDESGKLLEAMKAVPEPNAWFWVDVSCLDATRFRLTAVVSRMIRYVFVSLMGTNVAALY